VVHLARSSRPLTARRRRARVAVRGAVQGVGFRPFVYRLAHDLALDGFVRNGGAGVEIEIEGRPSAVRRFLLRLEVERPERASIQGLEATYVDPIGGHGFAIQASRTDGPTTTLVMADIATCDDCLGEVLDPDDRRHRYPFTNCTNCGPRYSIIEALPYDRASTSMHSFSMCPACRAEYDDPRDRRYHAQPTACPECGPALVLWDGQGRTLAAGDDALRAAAAALGVGAVVAVKGLGGFHLMTDATSATAVATLRARKGRGDKPFAVMFASAAAVRVACRVSRLEARALSAPEAPIVLVQRRVRACPLTTAIAPDSPWVGALLPYTPLHHLLLADVATPLVATSGNLSEEPICTDEHEALDRLGDIADLFLVHDRPIVRPVDDSVVRIVLDRELLLRRARGYAPLPIETGEHMPPVLAVGGHLKNTVALAVDRGLFVSQHVGDLANDASERVFRDVISTLTGLYQTQPTRVAADLHPDYRSSRYAHATGLEVTRVQHHHAHVVACMADNDLSGVVLGVAWDGTGYGPDGTIWGGEFLLADAGGYHRLAALRPFRLPGGERAVTEPRRAAFGLLAAAFDHDLEAVADLAGLASFTARERAVLTTMTERGLNAPWTSSAGRLFDAFAALLGLRDRVSFEGQAAMAVEIAATAATSTAPLPAPTLVTVDAAGDVWCGPERPVWMLDWRPLVTALIEELRAGVAPGPLAAGLHHALAAAIVAVAVRADLERVVLSGGCFQNRLLTELTVRALEAAGVRPYWHQRLPPNDGGLAAGQLLVASARERRS